MDRKKLMIAGGLSVIALILVMVTFIFYISVSTDNLVVSLDSTDSYAENSVFDNKTPEEKALFIAKLSQGHGYPFADYNTANASLTSDGKYWIVEMTNSGEEKIIIVTVDAKTLMSKEDNGTWRSLDELKANYIADVYCDSTQNLGHRKPYNVTSNGKTIWKVAVDSTSIDYYLGDIVEPAGYVYFDPPTGKSKYVDLKGSTAGWMTLKELDDSMDFNPYGETPFRDALRDLYLE